MKPRIATTNDISGILGLQSVNLYAELTEREREMGFVTTPFTEKQMKDIIKLDGLFVSEEKGEIVAYVFAGDWSYFQQWPIFPYMTSRFPILSFRGSAVTTENSFQYGPICIDVDFRGKQVMPLVFEEMRLLWSTKFSLSITFINKINQISARAHEKLGWEIIDEFEFRGNDYLGLAFDMKKSVLSSQSTSFRP